jgi:uncharacterized protein YtpQ (UPF0354 family)
MKAAYINLIMICAALPCIFTESAHGFTSNEQAFTDHVAGLFRKGIESASVTVDSPLTLKIGELQANLDRIYFFCKRNIANCDREVERYVQGVTEMHKEKTTPPNSDSIRIVLRNKQYVEAAQKSVGGKGAEIQPRPFAGGLVALPVADSPRAVRMLGQKANAQLGLTEQEIFDLGMKNLRKTLKPLMDIAKIVKPGQIGRIAGDVYDPSRLLLLETWEPLARAHNGVLVVIAPTSDAVFYVGEDTPQAIDALRRLGKEVISRVPNTLSNVMLRWSATGWETVE